MADRLETENPTKAAMGYTLVLTSVE